MNQLPEAFLARLKSIVSEHQWETVVAGFHRPTPVCFRVNTLKTSVPALLHELKGENITPIPVAWNAQSFVVSSEQRDALTHCQAFMQGRLYIHNLSSIFAAQLLAAQPGEQVLDLAAAPGGKTLAIACAMKNCGRIAAVESVKSRFFRLKNNLELQGATMVECYLKDGRKVGRQVPEHFDRVLLDAPCSSESRFFINDPETFKYWSKRKIKDMQRKQKQLLHSALAALKPGGVLIYSTCSYAPEENEIVVDRQLRKWGDALDCIPIEPPFHNYQPGLTTWGKKALDSRLSRALRILPDDTMEGFFICMLKKIYS